jgi:signal transduction histidine kinase
LQAVRTTAEREAVADRGRLARLGPVVLLATLLLLTTVATVAAARRAHERERSNLDAAALAATDAIDRRMAAYTEVLHGASGLYEASRFVSALEFQRFFTGQAVQSRYPGVQVLGFARYLQGYQVEGYEHRKQRELREIGLGAVPFRVRPPARGAGAELVVIGNVQPVRGNEAALGLDFLSEPIRRSAALLARRTGRPAATAPIRLVQDRQRRLAVDLMVPVYGGPPSETGEQRPWLGVAYAAFRMDDLLRGVLGDVPADVDLEIYDLGPAVTTPRDDPVTSGTLTYNLRGGAHAARRDTGQSRINDVVVGQRRWAVYYARTGTSLTSTERAAPWVIGIGGVLLSLLAAALLHALTTARERAVRLAERMTAELRQREQELQRSNEELEHFAYLASHDLQEPLRTVTSYVGLLERRLDGKLDDRSRSWLAYITEGANRMSSLITDLLHYSRAGRSDEPPEPVPLDAAWDQAVANLRQAIEESGAMVTRGALPVVAASAREMTSLLQNLIANALKYRGEAAPEVHADAVRRDDAWEIRVQDNGIGIDPMFHDRVFGLFQRLHTAEEYPGTGMGLAIVKKLAESNGGSVRVESAPGRGATFVVTLPEAREA